MSTGLLRAGRVVLLGVLVVFSLAPFQWMLVASLKPGDEQLISGNPWWTASPDWANYARLLERGSSFRYWAANTLIVLVATLVISLVASVMAAYALAHLDPPLRLSLPVALFATYLLPQGVLFLPLVGMLSRAHLLNSLWALVLTYPGLVIPFGTWVLWNFFRALPRDMVDLARVEGAGTIAILLRLLLRPAAPALATVALFTVAIVFNDYLYAFAFVTDERSQTIVAALGSTSTDIADAGAIFAGVLIGLAPIALLCAFFAESYGRGLTAGIADAG